MSAAFLLGYMLILCGAIVTPRLTTQAGSAGK